MQKIYIIPVLLLSFSMLAFSSRKGNKTSGSDISLNTSSETDSLPEKKKKKPADEEIRQLMKPVPSAYPSADSARLVESWKLGIKFYKANCSSCHGIFGKGKDTIPNFSKEETEAYKIHFLRGDKTNHAVMAKMTLDELEAVFLFLSHLKTNKE